MSQSYYRASRSVKRPTFAQMELADARSKYDGREADVSTVIGQIGRSTYLGVSGGRCFDIENESGETVGVLLPCGESRAVEVVLDWNDTYTVRRVRRVARGVSAGAVVVEHETSDVYCDGLADAVWSASCWK